MSSITEYLAPDLLGSTYLYSDSSKANTSFGFVVSMTMAVDTSLLEQALNGLMPRFPHVCLKAVREGDSVVLAKRTAPVRVLPIGERENFSGSGSFGRDSLFAVFVNHKTMYFDFHRALTDEKGIVPFVRAVLYRYLQLGGYDVENDGSVITADSEYHDIEADDAFVKLDDIPASRPIWYMDAKAVNLPHRQQENTFRVTRIHVPLAKVKGEARLYTGMPSTIVSPFFSQALLEEYPEYDVQGEYMISYIQINLRQYFPTTTLRPFYVNVPLAYNRRLPEYPVATVLMSQKKFLEAQLKTDALAYNAQRKISLLEDILDRRTLEDKSAAMHEMLGTKAMESTYSLCNVGNVIMPDSMQQYVTEFYPLVPPVLFPFSISTINLKGDLVITVSSSDIGNGTCRRFVSLLKQYGVHAYISDSYLYSTLKYKPEL